MSFCQLQHTFSDLFTPVNRSEKVKHSDLFVDFKLMNDSQNTLNYDLSRFSYGMLEPWLKQLSASLVGETVGASAYERTLMAAGCWTTHVYDTSSCMGLRQRVNEPTHIKGNMLDLIFIDNDDARVSVLKQADITNDLPVSIKIPDDITIHEGPKRRLWMYH
ncbi:hypothetical protein CAPTEDRAFT_191865 [Capitella teleta]|uniref:Uncharacterized protein n=1 Tax=Capitella teleta TaxID=283909 RepID=R7TY47_CAPTE|nr:hypothetical protein CAPTEDRAFT_191865 [Capitella teleta]|eukprot:ELT98808.1 hypothetical protein CAPTEDRAFT_191865 [Capitella teleta]